MTVDFTLNGKPVTVDVPPTGVGQMATPLVAPAVAAAVRAATRAKLNHTPFLRERVVAAPRA